jgi:molybdopterin synthase sulfur carrier subunit
MPVTFLIPGPLRSFSGGQARIVIEASPANLAEALEALWKQCPGLRGRVTNEQAQIREHINLFVGNEDIRYTGGLQTPIPDGAEIAIIPAVSGGELIQAHWVNAPY